MYVLQAHVNVQPSVLRRCAVAGLNGKVLIHITATCVIHWMQPISVLVCVFMEGQVDEAVHTLQLWLV